MCSELTPRARIPDTRIPQLMQEPWMRDTMMRLFNLLLSPIGRVASRPMRIIDTFPSKHMYLYLSLVGREVAEFYHNMVKMTYFHRFLQTINGVLETDTRFWSIDQENKKGVYGILCGPSRDKKMIFCIRVKWICPYFACCIHQFVWMKYQDQVGREPGSCQTLVPGGRLGMKAIVQGIIATK